MKFFQKTLSYGIDRQRVMQTLSDGTTTRTKRYFTPLYETITENGVTKKLHYLTSSTGLFAIFVSYNNGGGTMHHTLKDHQGNLTAATCSGSLTICQVRISAFIMPPPFLPCFSEKTAIFAAVKDLVAMKASAIERDCKFAGMEK